MSLHCFEIKIKSANKGLNTPKKVLNQVQAILDSPMQYHSIDVASELKLQSLECELKETYGKDVVIRSGVSGGCYGMRDGSQSEGLTLYFHPSCITDRTLDDERNEYANIHKLIEENGGKLIKNSAGDVFDGDDLGQVFEDAGHEVRRDNSYNWSGRGDVEFIFDFDFGVIETSKKALLFIKYHCGGDPRGNYTNKIAYSFDSIDDLYSCLRPCKMIGDESDAV